MTALALNRRGDNATRDTNINMRVPSATKDLLDRAAKLRGTTLSAFMTESALRAAEDTLLDQRLFVLSQEQFAVFQAALDNPPPPNAALKSLLRRKPLWEK